jgi:hypothetical protein
MAMISDIPARDDNRWQDARWRTDTLLKIMHDLNLKGHDVAGYTGNAPATVYCWRTVAVRPIPVNDLKVLMFEIERDHGQA